MQRHLTLTLTNLNRDLIQPSFTCSRRTLSITSIRENAKKYFLLRYKYNPENLVERRAPHRPAHLELAKEYASKGQLLLGGAFAPKIDGAAIVFHATRQEVEDFVKKDPYVLNGIATEHEIREWTVLVGSKLEG